VCAGLQFLSASQRHPSQSCVLSVRGTAQECIDHYGTSGFLASGLDENNDGTSSPRPFIELSLGQSKPGDVGLRNMLNGASSARQGQGRFFIKNNLPSGSLSGAAVTDTSRSKWTSR
jgi:hypothetical protein